MHDGVDPLQFGEDFARRVFALATKGERPYVTNTGVVLGYADEQKTRFYMLGCVSCLAQEPTQNAEGYPTINGKGLISAVDIPEMSPQRLPPELMSNIWVCPDCRRPITQLLPEFHR